MNRIFNEGVSSSVSRVSGVSGVSGQCRQSCDIPTKAVPKATKRPNNETAIKISFNGIFESKPRSEGSVASDSTNSPVVSPMVALNHNRQSPTSALNVYNDRQEERMAEDNGERVHSKRGRKRKVKEMLDPLKDKLDVRKRIHKSQTTEELAQKFNIEVKINEKRDDIGNNRIVTTIRTNRKHNKNVSNNAVDDNETESKSELMQRFFSSQSSTTSPAIQDSDNYYNYNSFSDQHVVTSAQSVPHSSAHSVHPSVSLEQSSYPLPQQLLSNVSSDHQKTDSVSDEIKDILSHLPPLYVNDIDWSDCEPNDNKCSDNDYSSDDNRDHNHNRGQRQENSLKAINSDLETNNDSNNSNNNLINNNSKLKQVVTPVSDYVLEKYCEQKWEYVNGTYDSETEWRPWNQMTSAVSYNGDVLHILPYVDINYKDINHIDTDSQHSSQ